jgi:hypothetical protein
MVKGDKVEWREGGATLDKGTVKYVTAAGVMVQWDRNPQDSPNWYSYETTKVERCLFVV